MQGASWQRCKVHFYRNILAHVPQSRKLEVAAALKIVFGQVSMEAAQRAAGEFRALFGKTLSKALRFSRWAHRRACLLRLPARASSEHRDDQSHRASQQGNPPANALDWHLPIT